MKKDLERIHEIRMNPRYICRLSDDDTLRVVFSLSHDNFNDVLVTASVKDEDMTAVHRLSYDFFEECLKEVVKEVLQGKDMLLEDHEEIKHILEKLIDELILNLNKRYETDFYIKSENLNLTKGLGIITHKHKNEDIGTFERLSLNKNIYRPLEATFHHMIGFNELTNEDSYQSFVLIYYSFEHNKFFQFEIDGRVFLDNESVLNASITNPMIDVGKFDASHPKFEFINNQISYQEVFPDGMNPLDYDEFRSIRINALNESKERRKKEQIVEEFSDIEI